MLLYLDNCCYNRPWDDQRQIRIRREAESVLYIIEDVRCGVLSMAASDFTYGEIADMPDTGRQEKVLELVSTATIHVSEQPGHYSRASTFAPFNIAGYDALHLAAAESAGADYFLTTDDRLLNRSRRARHILHLTVLNPLDWPPAHPTP